MSLQFEPLTANLASSRNWVAAQAQALDRGLSRDHLAVLKLLSSELITNAILHGPARGLVTVRVLRKDGHLRVEVDDEGSAPPQLRDPETGASGGRGILLIDTYSARWGWESLPAGGKTVWFDLSADQPRIE